MRSVAVEGDDYLLGDLLGRGAHGQVYRGFHAITGATVAIKVLNDLHRTVLEEIRLLRSLRHDNVVRYHASTTSGQQTFLVMEFCENGSLFHMCRALGTFPEGLLCAFLGQVLRGLIYLHSQGVVHCDIKAANILTTKEGIVKLADFGVASVADSSHNVSIAGSPYWMAPEVIELQGASPAADVWSVGCTVVELLTGHPPYADLDAVAAMFRIVSDGPSVPEVASSACRHFLEKCWHKSPSLRPSAASLSRHPWLKQAPHSHVKAATAQIKAFHTRVDRGVDEGDWELDFAHNALERFGPRRTLDLAKYRDNDDETAGLSFAPRELPARDRAHISDLASELDSFDSFETESIDTNVVRVRSVAWATAGRDMAQAIRTSTITADEVLKRLKDSTLRRYFLQARGLSDCLSVGGPFLRVAANLALEAPEDFVALGGCEAVSVDPLLACQVAELLPASALRLIFRWIAQGRQGFFKTALRMLRQTTHAAQKDLIRDFARLGGVPHLLGDQELFLAVVKVQQVDVPREVLLSLLQDGALDIVRHISSWPRAATSLHDAGIWRALQLDLHSLTIAGNICKAERRQAEYVEVGWLSAVMSLDAFGELILPLLHAVAAVAPDKLWQAGSLDFLLAALGADRWSTQAIEILQIWSLSTPRINAALLMRSDEVLPTLRRALGLRSPSAMGAVRLLKSCTSLIPLLGQELVSLALEADPVRPGVTLEVLKIFRHTELDVIESIRRLCDSRSVLVKDLALELTKVSDACGHSANRSDRAHH
ncbi:Protein kinase of the Mitotic Exit Network [Savitreella phatthalungensis]